MLRKCFAWAVVAVLAAAAAPAQTAYEIIEKNIAAKGGREKIKGMQTVRMTGTMAMGQGMEAPFTMEIKRPSKMRMEFTIQGMTGIQAYDGTTGWMVMPFMGKKEPERMSEDDLKNAKEQADFEGPLLDYKDKGHQVEYVGKVDVEGSPAHKLKLTEKSGDVSYIYLDADAFLEIKSESKRKVRGQELEFETSFGDYKEVGGMLFPHSLEIKAKGAPAAQTLTFTKIEVNPEVADSRFAMPETPADPADTQQ